MPFCRNFCVSREPYLFSALLCRRAPLPSSSGRFDARCCAALSLPFLYKLCAVSLFYACFCAAAGTPFRPCGGEERRRACRCICYLLLSLHPALLNGVWKGLGEGGAAIGARGSFSLPMISRQHILLLLRKTDGGGCWHACCRTLGRDVEETARACRAPRAARETTPSLLSISCSLVLFAWRRGMQAGFQLRVRLATGRNLRAPACALLSRVPQLYLL